MRAVMDKQILDKVASFFLPATANIRAQPGVRLGLYVNCSRVMRTAREGTIQPLCSLPALSS